MPLRKFIWLMPLLLAAVAIASGFGFVKYYNSYEKLGEHWSPESPIAHETARFRTDMGAEGDYRVRVEKLISKFPLLFVEYQLPGTVLDMMVHSDDGMVRFSQQFADEGTYQISVQHTLHPNHTEVIDFTVQTPLVKYTNDMLLLLFLLWAGYVSGRRLRALAVVCLLATVAGFALPDQAMAHGIGGEHQAKEISNQASDITLAWLHGQAPVGEANRTPMDWTMRLTKAGVPIARAAFDLDFIHLESGFPVLHTEGISTDGGLINLKYSPPDGTAYQLRLRTVIDGRVYHLALRGEADAIPPTVGRKWASFLLMMVPLSIGMFWGWKRGEHG